MSHLSKVTPLSWPQTKQYAEFVRENGIQQFIHQYHRSQGRQGDCLKWGDEVSEISWHLTWLHATAAAQFCPQTVMTNVCRSGHAYMSSFPSSCVMFFFYNLVIYLYYEYCPVFPSVFPMARSLWSVAWRVMLNDVRETNNSRHTCDEGKCNIYTHHEKYCFKT